MTKCKWYKLDFHKWVKYNSVSEREYLGELYKDKYESHRVCLKCGSSQEMKYDSSGFYWSNLNEKETTILNDKIKEGSIIL